MKISFILLVYESNYYLFLSGRYTSLNIDSNISVYLLVYFQILHIRLNILYIYTDIYSINRTSKLYIFQP